MDLEKMLIFTLYIRHVQLCRYRWLSRVGGCDL